MLLSYSEENYLKSIYHLSMVEHAYYTTTNSIAGYLAIKPASVTSMLIKLRKKSLIEYERYGKVTLTQSGKQTAIQIIRKHRLWETFLVEKLSYSWEEVHEIAEQLEHIQSQTLIDRLDKYLDFPTHDPHGDPIPSAIGELAQASSCQWEQTIEGTKYEIIAVSDRSKKLLKEITQKGLQIGTRLTLVKRENEGVLISFSNKQNENLTNELLSIITIKAI